MKSRFGGNATLVEPGSFEPERHFYPRVLNAQIHPTVSYFLSLSAERLIKRYCHMNPQVDAQALQQILSHQPRYFRWAGADLFHVATARGTRQMVVIETNSCPSGQKSMPVRLEGQEEGGYRLVIERCFLPAVQGRRLPSGGLAVVYDKNLMEASGYASALAECSGESVYLTELHDGDPDPPARFCDQVLQVRDSEGNWQPIRAAFRYLTQRPWNRLPLHCKSYLFNPIISCLSGGRNKMVAAKAYDLYNAELAGTGLKIRVPETIADVSHNEIPLCVRRFGGLAVVKIPYSNAGQGVFTITSERELHALMERPTHYDQFIVQGLIGNIHWSSRGREGQLYHVATMPNKRGQSYVADLRMMVCATDAGFLPVAIYGRRSRSPLPDVLARDQSSWDILGTNLSSRLDDGGWETDTQRLLLMDRRDFNALGLGVDDVIEAYVQTVLAAIAIDRLAVTLTTQKGRFRMKLFRSMDNDPTLLSEILA